MERAGFEVFRVNPKRSHDAAEVYDGVPSLHDAKSAAIVAKLHLDAASERWAIRSDQERELDGVVNTAVGILGPLMIMLMGGFVFVIVIALLLPIFQLNQLVR